MKTQILPGIFIINGFRAIYIEKINSLIISDLQIGYELYLVEKGIFVPQIQLKEMKKDISKLIKICKPKNLIINGDLKHEFGEASSQEWREVFEFLNFVRKKVERIILVRGNHDNYLLNIINKLNLTLYDPFYEEKGFLFTHGHKKINFPEYHTLIIGHEQPAIELREEFSKIKIHCLLLGKTKKGKDFICLPAFSPLASGSSVNLIGKNDLISPILREEVEFYDLIPIGLDKSVGYLKFPKLGKIALV